MRDRLRVPAGSSADEALLRATLAQMDSFNVVLAIGSGEMRHVERWRAAAPGRILGAPTFPCLEDGTGPHSGGRCFASGAPLPEVDWLREEYRAGRLAVMGELIAPYVGVAYNDPVLDPYFALAEELDIPVAVHVGAAAPRTPYGCCPKFRVALGNPLLLEDVLVRHPRLRLYLMHAGGPFLQETIAVMQMYPQVYADLSAISIALPRPQFHHHVRRLVEAGLADRLLFGSDFSLAIGQTVRAIEAIPFLTPAQKQGIFYDNAARFLHLDVLRPSRPR